MPVPYYLSPTQSHALLYPLSDGRFQIVEKGELAPLMIGFGYVIVEKSFAEYLRTLDIAHLKIIDAIIYNPIDKKESRDYKQLLIDLHFLPESISSIDLSRDLFLLMGEKYLFVSPSLKDRLEASPFRFFRFSHGLSSFADQRYVERLKSVEELRRWDAHPSIIERAEELDRHRDRGKDIARRIREAFSGVTLGDGIGLWQAQEIDNYEDAETVAKARELDEKEDWGRITSDDLNACNSSLSFFDAEGMRFHLPAFLIAALEDNYLHGMAFCLCDIDELREEQFALLSPPQRAVIREYLQHIAVDDDYEFERPNILRALDEYWSGP